MNDISFIHIIKIQKTPLIHINSNINAIVHYIKQLSAKIRYLY